MENNTYNPDAPVTYKRSEFRDELIDFMKNQPEDQKSLENGLDAILQKIEKRVSLVTFETNAFATLLNADNRTERI